MGHKGSITTTTTTNTTIRDIGFTGNAGVDLALGLADVGLESSKISAGITNVGIATAADLTSDSISQANNLSADTLDKLIQRDSDGFNQLIGGAGLFVTSATEQATNAFDKIVSAGNDVLKTGADAIARLGPQTTNNQNLAFAGLAVAALMAFVAFRRK